MTPLLRKRVDAAVMMALAPRGEQKRWTQSDVGIRLERFAPKVTAEALATPIRSRFASLPVLGDIVGQSLQRLKRQGKVRYCGQGPDGGWERIGK